MGVVGVASVVFPDLRDIDRFEDLEAASRGHRRRRCWRPTRPAAQGAVQPESARRSAERGADQDLSARSLACLSVHAARASACWR
jgi:hypothetical protein